MHAFPAPRWLRCSVSVVSVVAVLAILAVLATSGCGDDNSDIPKRYKAARITVGDGTCQMQTDGFTFPAGKLPIQIINKTQAEAEVAFRAGSETKATVSRIPAGATVDRTVELPTGSYQTVCIVSGATVEDTFLKLTVS